MKTRRIFAVICAIAMMVSFTGSFGNVTRAEERAKYIFLFIGDGMGNSHVAATESYLSYKAGKLGGEQLCFTQFPYLGLATTYSANANITCSSAAGTAIACGAKTNNGMVGVDPEGNNLESMAVELKRDGYKVGIMSSVPINHATPASFYAHNASRNDNYGISMDIPASGFDFFGGDGFLDLKGKRGDKEATNEVLEKNGYKVCYGTKEFKAAAKKAKKIVFCQEDTRATEAEQYTTDGGEVVETPLAEVVELAIDYLGDKKPFFIMCEGGAIDWEAHGNQTMGTIRETIEFDKAIQVAYEFYLAHPDETLIVVTADHETGGLTLGAGRDMINWEALETEWLENGKKSTMDSDENRRFNKSCSIGWTTGSHTGGAVPMFAIGAGAEKFNGRMDNTDIKGKILGE